MEFIASIEELQPIFKWIQEKLKIMEFSSGLLHKVELASEEALVNIIHHAYQERPEKVEVKVDAFPGDYADITFIDHGPPFNPLEEKPVNLNCPLEERKLGGLGIHFIRKSANEVFYAREGKTNKLTIRFRK